MNKNRFPGLFQTGPQKIFFFFLLMQCQGLGWAQTPQMPENNSCLLCHADMQEDMKGSIHAQQGISCDRCHGGDPAQPTKELAKAPGTGYIGSPNKQQIAEMCGTCHANVEVMNFYGIRTDQLAQYKTSMHGKKLFEGDTNVAVCSDCHGEHDILPVGDPGSSVYPLNIPKTCNRCHGNEKLMSQYKLPADIFKTYQHSVHGKALLEEKDLSAASCISCHGYHGAVPPGARDVGTTCGKCHMNEKKYFLESVHAGVSAQGKFSECISCHGNHGVQPASKALYDQACVRCHSADTPEAKRGGEIHQMLNEAEEKLRSTTALVKQASIEGFFVEPEMAALEAAKTNVIAMAPLQHTLSPERISELHKKVVSAAADIARNIHQKQQFLRWRKLSLIPMWAFIAMMISALWIKYRQLHSHSREKQDEKEKRS
jgi:hypothetical protein